MHSKIWKVFFLFVLPFYSDAQKPVQLTPAHGKYAVGFDTLRMTARDGNTLLISLWYPARTATTQMKLRDYLVTAHSVMGTTPDSMIENFKNSLVSLYTFTTFPDEEFYKLLATTTKASAYAKRLDGKFGLIIAQAQPSSYLQTFEYFASHGFVVAGVMWNYKTTPQKNADSLLYKLQTDYLQDVLNYMIAQPFVNPAMVTAFGHGGGIQPAVYLAMRTPQIQKIINLDGGFFGARSKSTLSTDYVAEKLQGPMLHVITSSQAIEDDLQQKSLLKNPITQIKLVSDKIKHHDFTLWGKFAAELVPRADKGALNRASQGIHKKMLSFLTKSTIGEGKDETVEITHLNF